MTVTTTCPASCAKALPDVLRENLARIHQQIADAGRDPSSVRIVAVTKTWGSDAVRAAFEAGLRHVGENYLAELEAKRPEGPDGLCWHYLGALQTNKIARIAAQASVISGVSRAKEIAKLAQVAPASTIDVQVDVTGLAQRNGAPAAEVPDLVAQARDAGLTVRGLMVVAPPEALSADRAFALVADLADHLGVTERSMGMSDDFVAACRRGSTEVRLGRVLFGPRSAVPVLS